jgi:hypothetical protein
MTRFATIPAALVLVLSAAGQDSHRPTLKETFEWMHSAFPDSRTMIALRANETRELNFVEGKGDDPPSCTITIVERWKTPDGKPAIRDTVIDLSLIDPDSIKWYTDDTAEKGQGVLTMTATNDKKVIVEKLENEKNSKPYFTQREFISFIGPEYAERFAKAFKNAVTLCGGKASSF